MLIPDIYKALYDALKQVITAAWPEVFGPTHPILRVTQAERRAWRSLMDAHKLESPWVVVQIPPTAQETGWGACNVVYKPRVTVFYVTEMGSGDIAARVSSKLAVLEDTLMRTCTGVSIAVQDVTGAETGEITGGFQYLFNGSHDVSEENPANASFLALDLPMFAGSFSFDALIGYMAP